MARILPGDTLFLQRLLACAGFYKGKLDGYWGPLTEAALLTHQRTFEEIRGDVGSFDLRSENAIATLLPVAQVKARRFMRLQVGRPLKCVILSGTRTYAEQNALYAKRPKVTNARGGQSNHNFGIAWDIGLFDGPKYLTGGTKAERKAYADVAAIAKDEIADLAWGGDWVSFADLPHFHLMTGKSLADMRAALEAGRAFV